MTLLVSIFIYRHKVNLMQCVGLAIAVGAMVFNFLDKGKKKRGECQIKSKPRHWSFFSSALDVLAHVRSFCFSGGFPNEKKRGESNQKPATGFVALFGVPFFTFFGTRMYFALLFFFVDSFIARVRVALSPT